MRSHRLGIVLLVIGCCSALIAPAFSQKPHAKPTQQQINQLVKNLKSPDSEARDAAAIRLGKMGSAAAPALPGILGILKGKDMLAALSAADALGKMGPTASPLVPRLIELIRSKDSDSVLYGTAALAEMAENAGAAVPALTDNLKKEDRFLRYGTAGALGEIAEGTGKGVRKMGAPERSKALALWLNTQSAVRSMDSGGLPGSGGLDNSKEKIRRLVEALRAAQGNAPAPGSSR